MIGSPNPDSYDLADTLRMRLAESSRPRPATSRRSCSSSRRAGWTTPRLPCEAALIPRSRASEAATAGAFDSPQGFVFIADA